MFNSNTETPQAFVSNYKKINKVQYSNSDKKMTRKGVDMNRII